MRTSDPEADHPPAIATRVHDHRRRPARLTVVLAFLVALSLTMPLGPVRPAVAEDNEPLVAGWLPSWATEAATSAVRTNADLFGEASPFWFGARAENGSVRITSSVSAATMISVVATLRASGATVIPSVADVSSAKAMAKLLRSPTARTAHVNQLVALVTAHGFDGIELDYEQFSFHDGYASWAATRPAWVSFVHALANGLHRAGKQLAIAVPPVYASARKHTSGYWVYDYAAIGPYVDSLRIMTYDYSVTTPGPIAPLSFVRKTLAYATTVVPRARIRMGIPAYGRLWVARKASGKRKIKGTCPTSASLANRSFTASTANTYLADFAGSAPTITFDAAKGEATTTFTKKFSGHKKSGKKTSCTVTFVAWWVDERGVAARLPLVSEYGLAGVAIWHLGGADPASWRRLRSYAQAWSAPVPQPIGQAPTTITPTVTAQASTLRPKPGGRVTLKVKLDPETSGVTVSRQQLVKGSWVTKSTKSTDASGRVAFSMTWPKKRTSRTFRIVTSAKGQLATGASDRVTVKTR